MKKIIIISLIFAFSILYLECGKKVKEKGVSTSTKTNNNVTVSEVESSGTTTSENRGEEVKTEEVKTEEKVSDESAGDEFFKGGVITRNGEEIGIYIVESGDSVWEIAKKYAGYLRGGNPTKTDIGNAAYRINKENYKELFGGVNDELKIGMKIRVPITKIKKDLKLDE